MLIQNTNPDYDAIVVGSGMTGGWAAKELTELGVRTLVLEAGRTISPETDAAEHVQPWEMRFRGMGDRRHVESCQRMKRYSVLLDELSHRHWTDEEDTQTSHPAD